jgi:aryl-alcohol dehydrogenase-like predicted oxidoreductase
MKRIRIPHSDIVTSKAVFGTSRLGGTVERYDKREALAILGEVLDAGIDCFDTADIYAQGNCERLIAEAFRGSRDRVIYTTKGGYVLSAKARVLSKVKPLIRRFLKAKPGLVKAAGRARGGQMGKDFSRGHLTRALEASLSRLRTDRIDIYQLHSPDPSDLTAGDAFATLAGLKAAGKIRAYGVSVLSWDDVPHCLGHGVSWIQVDADLLGGNDHAETIKRAQEDKVMLVARQAFASGRLSRYPVSLTPADFGGNETGLSKAKAIIERLRKIGDPHEVVLRYLHHHSDFGAFLFATTRMRNLRANLGALQMDGFPDGDAEALKAIFQNADSSKIYNQTNQTP